MHDHDGQTVAIELSSQAAGSFALLRIAEAPLALTVGLLLASVRWAAGP